MAGNSAPMLLRRIITGIILIFITLVLLFRLTPGGFGILTGLITLYAAWEWSTLASIHSIPCRLLYVGFIALLLVAVLFAPIQIILICSCIFWLYALLLIVLYPNRGRFWQKSIFKRAFMGAWVLVPCWVSLNYIRSQSDGIMAILFLFILVWGADSCAYFIGKRWGSTKLAPLLSPGKSWQGVIAELLFVICFVTVLFWFLKIPIHFWLWGICLALATILFSIVGDLFESMHKRQAGVKDSGRFLPGHGGLLDRIDSLTAAAPTFALGATLLGTYL